MGTLLENLEASRIVIPGAATFLGLAGTQNARLVGWVPDDRQGGGGVDKPRIKVNFPTLAQPARMGHAARGEGI